MRGDVPQILTAGRIRSGDYASDDSFGLTGMFLVTAPMTGRLLKIMASDGEEWEQTDLPGPPWEHVSVSLAKEPEKCPSWPEMDWVCRLFWRPDEAVIQFHPPEDSKVNRHHGCLHMWRVQGLFFPLPPREAVG